jgi:hypothetical protein
MLWTMPDYLLVNLSEKRLHLMRERTVNTTTFDITTGPIYSLFFDCKDGKKHDDLIINQVD